jgi:hypothetical protein
MSGSRPSRRLGWGGAVSGSPGAVGCRLPGLQQLIGNKFRLFYALQLNNRGIVTAAWRLPGRRADSAISKKPARAMARADTGFSEEIMLTKKPEPFRDSIKN